MLAAPEGAPEKGCDDVVFVAYPMPETSHLLTVALDTLFAIERDSVGGARHFLGRTNETLALDSVVVADGTARVFLTGRLTGLRGVCDHPRARIQIAETVKGLADVDRVSFILNGAPTDLQPNGRGRPADDP